MPQPTLWERTRFGGRVGFDKLYGWVDKLGAPVTKISHKLGAESFWPTTLDKEADKAARILRSFCKDGFYEEEERSPITQEGPKQKQKVMVNIPAAVIKNAKGLAIFTVMRTGLWMSGAGGSGIIVGRLPDGSWSPPSGIMLHTAGLGFLLGVDVYDCVLVINTDQAMEAFSRLRCTVGGELSAVAGPVGVGGMVESELHKRQAPIYTYLKSRGFYAGVQIDGTIMLERNEENERFYNEKLSGKDIISGKVRHAPYELQGFFATLRAAEGDKNVDESLLPSEAPPSDFEIDHEAKTFGIPDKDDPDPYGVLSLEKEGMVIREAGTHKRASWEQFTFAPSITSPVYDTFDKRSTHRDSRSLASNRSSFISVGASPTIGPPPRDKSKPQSPMFDMATQTDDLPPPPSPRRNSARSGTTVNQRSSMDHIPEDSVAPPSPSIHSSSARLSRRTSGLSSLSRNATPPHDSITDEPKATTSEKTQETPRKHEAETGEVSEADDSDEDDASDHDDVVVFEEAPVVQTIQKATVPQVIQKARMVSVPRRGPPPRLPPRNPNRSRGPLVIDAERHEGSDAGSLTSPPLEDHEEESSPFHGFDGEHNPHESGSPAETPEEQQRDPWAKVMEQHSGNASQESFEMPGAFHSLPATPDEHAGHHAAKTEEDDFS